MIVPTFLFMLAGSPVAFTVQKQAWDAATSTAYLDVATGDLDGDGQPDTALLKLVCADGAVTNAFVRPRDSASGMPTGKRQHGSITITKEWGPSSPQFRGASPTYDVKKMEGGKTMATDDWTAVRLNGLPPGVCATTPPAAGAAIIKSKSNITNN